MAKKRELQSESEPEASDADWFEVEKIVDMQVDKKGKLSYLIKWKGYPASQNTWEKAEDVDADALVQAFHDERNNEMAELEELSSRRSPRKKKAKSSPSKKAAKEVSSPRRSPKKERVVSESEAEAEAEEEEQQEEEKPRQRGEPEVKLVRKISRAENGSLEVVLQLENGQVFSLPSAIANEKYPQLVIAFYESKIKFRT